MGNVQWKLLNVKSTEIDNDATRVTNEPEFVWSTVLRPSILNVYQVAPERLEQLCHHRLVPEAGAGKPARMKITTLGERD